MPSAVQHAFGGPKDNKSLSNKITTLTTENTNLREQLDGKKNVLATENEGVQKLGDIEALLNRRLDKIENSIDSIITKKLGESMKEVTQIGAKIDDAITNKKTFAESVGGNVSDSLTAAFHNRKNEEMVQEQEREKRVANLIIYGINEPGDGDPK